MFRLALPFAALLVGASSASAAPHVEGVRVAPAKGRVDVVVTASEPLTFQSFVRNEPAAIVVDLLETDARARTFAGAGDVQQIALSHEDGRGGGTSRLEIPLKALHKYDVTASGNTVTISVFDDKPAVLLASNDAPSRGIEAGEMGRATATDAVVVAQAAGARQMSYIGFKNLPNASRVFARLNDKAEFAVRKEGDNLVVLEIRNATIPLRNNKNHLDSQYFDSPVKMITPSEIEDATPTIRITIEMKEAVPFEAKLEGNEIAVYFKKS